MRIKIDPSKRYKARGLSLSPDMEKFAVKKAQMLDVGFSKYVQRLIRADREQTILKPV